MKPQRNGRMQGDTGSTQISKGKVSIDDKSAGSHVKSKSRVSCSTPVKPLVGKVFYLDLPSNRKTEALERDISQLGGIVEKFFSKEIKFLVSNKKEAKYVKRFILDSPVPGPNSGQSSPHPHQTRSYRNNLKNDTQGQVDFALISRGKSLVDKVVKEQERIHMNRTLSKALEWGVKILYVDDILAFVEKYKKMNGTSHFDPSVSTTRVKAESKGRAVFQKFKGKRISTPFIKVEDSSRHYRPVYHTMSEMPEINLKTAPPCSPFCPEVQNHPQNKHRGNSEERGQEVDKKKGDQKRVGFCECCQVNYDNVLMHVQGERHVAFSKSDAYLVVDRLVSTLKFNFVSIKSKPVRPKCSISSIILAPGPYEGPTQMHGADIYSANNKADQRGLLVLNVPGKTSTGHSLRRSSASDTRHRDNASGHPRPKRRSLACKEYCSKGSFSVQAHEAELAWVMRPKVEKCASRGDCDVATDFEAHRLQTGKNDSTSHNRGGLQKVFPSSSPVVADNNEESVKIQNSSVDSVLDGQVPPGQNTKNIPQYEQGNSLYTLKSPSPVGNIQRKVRAYKRKRRKMDTCFQKLASSLDKPDDSIPTFWHLFQSSENPDLDFQGFDD